MGIGYEHDIPGLGIAQLGNQLMDDTPRGMEMLDAIFLDELIGSFQALGVIFQAGRRQMVMHNGDLIRIPDLFHAHLVQFLQQERRVNIVDHHKIRLHDDQVTWFQIGAAGMVHEDLFC